MLSVTINIPDELAANFETPDAIRQALPEEFVIERRQRAVISLGKAAELLGLTYADSFDLRGSNGLSPINAGPQELDESYHRLVELLDRA